MHVLLFRIGKTLKKKMKKKANEIAENQTNGQKEMDTLRKTGT